MHGMCLQGMVSCKIRGKTYVLLWGRWQTPMGVSRGVILSHGQESGECSMGGRDEDECPAGAAAASAAAWEQSQRSSALPGLVSVTTISVLEGTYQSEPTWRLWSGPTSASYHFFFFFFFGGSGRRLCRRNHEKPERGSGLPAPAHDNSMEWRPIIRHRLFSRTLPTVTCRNLV